MAPVIFPAKATIDEREFAVGPANVLTNDRRLGEIQRVPVRFGRNDEGSRRFGGFP